MEDKRQEPLTTNRFSFEEIYFRRYYELHLRPHDKHTGWKSFWWFLIVTFVLLFFLCLISFDLIALFGSENDYAKTRYASGIPLLAVLLPLVALSVFCLVYSIRLMAGRMPKWEGKRWRAKTELVFRHLGAGKSDTVLPPNIEFKMSPMFVLNGPVSFFDSWYDEGIYFDLIPYLYPRYGDDILDPQKQRTPYKVAFEAHFYPDRIEKGRHREVFVSSYSDVHSIVEDKRYPELAIIRSKQKCELVILKNDFDVGTWEDVKAFLNARIKFSWKDDTRSLEEFLEGGIKG